MTNIYVGNLSFDVADAQLQEAFSAFGAVDQAKVVVDRETGRSRGFGFVEMANDGEANAAIEGALEAGATGILVVDGHGFGSIDQTLLHPEARLVAGRPMPAGFPFPCRGPFDPALSIG